MASVELSCKAGARRAIFRRQARKRYVAAGDVQKFENCFFDKTANEISPLFDLAKPLPKPTPPPLPDVPEGRYAVEVDGVLKFYRYDRPTEGKWAGATFLKVQASDDLWPIKSLTEKVRILALVDGDKDGKCTTGELWAQVDAEIKDDAVANVALDLSNAACPTQTPAK